MCYGNFWAEGSEGLFWKHLALQEPGPVCQGAVKTARSRKLDTSYWIHLLFARSPCGHSAE